MRAPHNQPSPIVEKFAGPSLIACDGDDEVAEAATYHSELVARRRNNPMAELADIPGDDGR